MITSIIIFQSTRPVRGATKQYRKMFIQMDDFNPRAPCGARPQREYFPLSPSIFQSTRPVRGATILTLQSDDFTKISIHAPRAGRDLFQQPL